MLKIAIAVGAALALGAAASLSTAHTEQTCDDLLQAPREVRGHKVGPASCVMQEAHVAYEDPLARGRRPRRDCGRFAVRWATTRTTSPTGRSDVPQTGAAWFSFVATCSARRASMTVVFLRRRRVERPSSSSRPRPMSGRRPEAWTRTSMRPLADLDRYERLMVAKPRACQDQPHEHRRPGRSPRARRFNGRLHAFNDTARPIMNCRRVARTTIVTPRPRAGATVSGHSAGADQPQHQLHARPQRGPRRRASSTACCWTIPRRARGTRS